MEDRRTTRPRSNAQVDGKSADRRTPRTIRFTDSEWANVSQAAAAANISTATFERETGHWVHLIAGEYEALQPQLLDRLVARGILSQREGKLSWLHGIRCYPTVDDRPQRDVKQRITDTVASEVIPHPRDIAIICLADACALWPSVIDERELAEAKPRIEQIVKMDLIGQSVTRTIRELQDATRGEEAKWFR